MTDEQTKWMRTRMDIKAHYFESGMPLAALCGFKPKDKQVQRQENRKPLKNRLQR